MGAGRAVGPRRPAVQEFVGIGGERSWDPSFLPQVSWKPAALGAGRARVGLSRELAETRRGGPRRFRSCSSGSSAWQMGRWRGTL